MTDIQLANNDFGFRSDAIHFLASLKYWALHAEAGSSASYSRVRKLFMGDDDKAREQRQYSDKKMEWVEEWYQLTARLLELPPVLSESDLGKTLQALTLNESKKNALSVELATFTPYHELQEESKEWESLHFDDDDRSAYLQYCALIMGENRSTLLNAWKEFNRSIEKIVRSNTGPNLTLVWVGLSAAALIILAPYLAGVIGGFMGLSGAAATSAGLALLGGGSLAAGGFGMTGGYVVLMAGGAILGYGSGSSQYKQKLRETSKEELLVNCGKLYAASKVFNIYGDNSLDICREALRIQTDLEGEADSAFLSGKPDAGKQLEAKAIVMRSFRRLLRGDL